MTWSANRRPLWLLFGAGFAASLLGLLVLFNPTLEFFAIDVIERLHLPIGTFGNLALMAELALFTVCGGGLIVLAVRRFLFKPSN